MEFVILLGIAFAVAAILIRRVRGGGTGNIPPIPIADGDRPDREAAEFEAARGRAPAGRR